MFSEMFLNIKPVFLMFSGGKNENFGKKRVKIKTQEVSIKVRRPKMKVFSSHRKTKDQHL